jgi:hypothetical protein
MATFAQVKSILDSLVVGKDPVRLRNKHGGAAFGWETAQALRDAVAVIAGDVYHLIDPAYVGNGQAGQTYLIRLLLGPIPEEDLPRMPRGGPIYANHDQVNVIREWINEGALDDPVVPFVKPSEPNGQR